MGLDGIHLNAYFHVKEYRIMVIIKVVIWSWSLHMVIIKAVTLWSTPRLGTRTVKLCPRDLRRLEDTPVESRLAYLARELRPASRHWLSSRDPWSITSSRVETRVASLTLESREFSQSTRNSAIISMEGRLPNRSLAVH